MQIPDRLAPVDEITQLVEKANAILTGVKTEEEERQTLTNEAIGRAHALVSPDLYVIEKLLDSGITPDIPRLLGAQMQEKIAAIIFLVKHFLLDIEYSTLESRDVIESRQNVQTLVKLLFHLKACDALAIFYEFATAQQNSRLPVLWQNVSDRCLYLLALLPESREQVLVFLHTHPTALPRARQFATSTRQDISLAFKALLLDYQRAVMQEQLATYASSPPPYVQMYHQEYEDFVPLTGAMGTASFLVARDRIEQAVVSGDIVTILQWIQEGSPDIVRETLHCAAHYMTNEQYIDLLERVIRMEGVDKIRITIAILELGTLNRRLSEHGGNQEINHVFVRFAMTEEAENIVVAKIVVRQLGSVRGYKHLAAIVENAPQLEVARAAIEMMGELHQLALVRSLRQHRPQIAPYLEAAEAKILMVGSIMESAISCPTPDLAMVYLERLRDLQAVYELNEISKRRSRVGELAQQILANMDPALTIKYY